MSVSTNAVLLQSSIYQAIRSVVSKDGVNDYDLDNLLRYLTQNEVGLEMLLLAEDGVISRNDLASKIDDAVMELLKLLKVDRADNFMERIGVVIEDIASISLDLGYITGNFDLPFPPWSHIVEITGHKSVQEFRDDLGERVSPNLVIRWVMIGEVGEVKICWAKRDP